MRDALVWLHLELRRVHQLAAFIQRIATPIGLLRFVPDDVSQRRLGHFGREAGHVPAQSRKLEWKPWTVASSIFIRRSIISIAMFDSGSPRA